jgi:hypothetical protein
VQDYQARMKLNGAYQLLAYADDVNLLGGNIDTININTETLIDASKEVGLEVNVEKTKYVLVSRDQNAGQNRVIVTMHGSKLCFQFRYLGTSVRNQNCIQVEIKIGWNSGNACYHSVQNLLSSRLLSRNVKIRIYKTIILPVLLYGCETWSLTLRQEHNAEENVWIEVTRDVRLEETT